MAGEHENSVLTALQVVFPILEGFNDGQELAIVSFIPSLGLKHFSRKISYWIPLATRSADSKRHL